MDVSNIRRTRSAGRRATAVAALACGLTALTGCGAEDDAADDVVTLSDLQGVDEQLTDLESRVDALENGALLSGNGTAPDANLFEDPRSFLGKEVSVNGEVSNVLDTLPSTSAFTVGADMGEPIAVVVLDTDGELTEGEVVHIEGSVVAVDEDGFESDFGVAAEEIFEDPDAFFERAEGDLAVSADTVTPADTEG